MTVKLSQFFASTGAVAVPLRNPATLEKLEGIEVHVFGKASQRYRDYTRNQTATLIEKQKSKAKNEITVDKIENDRVEFAAMMTSKITGMEAEDGSPLDNKAALIEVFKNPDLYWLLEQVEEAINDTTNFFKP
jgi:tryptophan 2,3-dioxygenase